MDVNTKKQEILFKLKEQGISPDCLVHHEDMFDIYCVISDVFIKEVFKEDYSKRLKIHDLIDHFENMEKQYGSTCKPAYETVIEDMKELSSYIKSSSSGNYGERVAKKALKRLKCNSYTLSNISIETDDGCAEFDNIVITTNGIFIIEVKSSRCNMVIDSDGIFHRESYNEKYRRYNIADSLDEKEYLLYKLLSKKFDGVVDRENIHSVILIAGEYKIHNNVEWIITTSCGTICHYIETFRSDKCRFFDNEMKDIYDHIDHVKVDAVFPLDFDLDRYAQHFAELLNAIDTYTTDKEGEEKTESEGLVEKEEGNYSAEPQSEEPEQGRRKDIAKGLLAGISLSGTAAAIIVVAKKLISNRHY